MARSVFSRLSEMLDDEGSLDEIEQRICNSPNPYASVGELAAVVIRLINAGRDRKELTNYFNQIIDSHALEASPERHVNYARCLVSSKATMFEEVFRVFSILEELEAMKILGLTPSQADETMLKSEFLQWASSCPDNLRKVADLFRDSWLQDSWFFRTLRE